MKKLFVLGLLVILIRQPQSLFAQVGIGITTPAATAILDLTSTTKGLLAPRMTQAQKNAISSPATGLTIYQTDGTSGYYFYNGTSWNQLSAPIGTASGDLSGSYPGPTVAKINGVTLGTTTATAGNLLIGNGTQWATNAMSGDGTISSAGALTLTNGAATRTNLGLGTGNSPTFTGLTATGLSTAGIVTNTSGGVLGTVSIVPTANLGTGTANSTTFLRGDGTWTSIAAHSIVTKGSDQNCTTTSWTDVTGLSFSVASGTIYRFQAIIAYTATASGDGIDFSIDGPATTFLAYQIHQPNNATTEYVSNYTAYDTGANTGNAIIAGGIVIITGIINPSANGTFIIRYREKNANKNIIKTGSCLEYW